MFTYCESISLVKFMFLLIQEPYTCSHAFMFNYRFAKPGKVILHTEYYLYDFISTLGNVGGTLGLFIGFSFSGTISYILNFIIARLNGQRNHQITDFGESPRNGLTLQKGIPLMNLIILLFFHVTFQ